MTARIVVNRAAVRALLKSDEVQRELERHGKRIASSAGDGYGAETYVGQNRARVTVRTATEDARRDEARNHNLLRALGDNG